MGEALSPLGVTGDDGSLDGALGRKAGENDGVMNGDTGAMGKFGRPGSGGIDGLCGIPGAGH